MRIRKMRISNFWLFSIVAALLLSAASARAQSESTTPNVQVDILGTGAESLLGGDLTDPENDGLDALGAATDPSWNWASIDASVEPDFEGGENSFNIFDNKLGGGNDKWCCDDPTPDAPVWVAVQFKQVVGITHFTVSSANDSPDRDPINWAIQGSNDGATYTDIYHFNEPTALWTERLQVIKFTLPSPSPAYKYIRYIAYDTPGTLHQIGEIEYFGIVGGADQTDTDKDGMPDFWEKQYGLNANDASDAAKDLNGNGISNLDEFKKGLDPTYTSKPTLVSATSSSTFDKISLTYTTQLDASTATNVANYAINGGLTVTGATLKGSTVTLQTSKQTEGGTAYTVTVNGIKNVNNFAIDANTKATVYSYLSTTLGVMKFSYWGAIDGTPVQGLYDDPRYPATPDLVGAVYSMNSRDAFADDSHENYGATIEGYITPTETADYRFFDRSDDASEFYLSTDATPANLTLLAQETGCCAAFMEPDNDRTSSPIHLVAGTKYFARLVYKEGGGGDYGQVAWRKEGDTTPAASLTPIPSKYLSSTDPLPFPAEGVFLTQSPAPNAKGVKANAGVTVVHIDGKTAWTAANVSLKVDGTTVTPTITKDGNTLSLTYKPTALAPSGSVHTVALIAPDAGGQSSTQTWTYTTYSYNAVTKDSVKGYEGLIIGKGKFTADAGGHTAKAGDYAIDSSPTGGGWVDVIDASFANAATANDTLSVSFWTKKYDIAAGSAFWFVGVDQDRAFQAHVPWSDNTIYFDTGGGCCDGTTQRINAGIDTFPDFVNNGDSADVSWWTNSWHHFVFTKKADQKNVYIDGKLFLNGSSSNPISKKITELGLLTDGVPGGDFMHGLLDDFAVYSSEITAADAAKLASGTSPKDLTGESLIAFWDFNDATGGSTGGNSPTIHVTRSGNTLTLTWEGDGFSMQSADKVDGPYTTVTSGVNGNTATVTIDSNAKAKFYRLVK